MMLKSDQRIMVRTYGTLLGRSLMGLLFLFTGAGILMGGPANTAGYFTGLGIPMATLVVWIVIAIKLGAGAALVLGYRVGAAATLLILFTLGATLVAHMNLEDVNLFKNLAIIGGLLYVIAYGAGEGWRM